MYQATMKRIIIEWSEGSSQENIPFTRWSAANAWLISIAAKRENRNGGYYKTAFKVEFDNGDTYTGRIDLEYSDTMKSGLLQGHIRDFQRCMGGLQKPYHMTVEDYQNYIHAMGDPQESIDFLTGHFLEDFPTTDCLRDYWFQWDDNTYPADNQDFTGQSGVISDTTDWPAYDLGYLPGVLGYGIAWRDSGYQKHGQLEAQNGGCPVQVGYPQYTANRASNQ